MKKLLLLGCVTFMFVSCNMTKTFTMLNAKSHMNMEKNDYIEEKIKRVNYLDFSDDQKLKLERLWEIEKEKLDAVVVRKNKNIAPIIYESELNFREVLTAEQREIYLKRKQNMIEPQFLSDKQLSELKRIYKLQ
ncbi:hypothetical protein GV828_11450 [Flavobacterium sp. NST-5]|uniref:Lipoprotein n=1 Tax=Flavobacterium ichthyis TaxID=2698827 RepID=A0ABW9ZCI9_9FLAO|nr:hypothetical protein [Flavobacterium ichthyis]NBL65816.1 hypothetical protein [Flavobacterium ichthyis]